MFSSMHKMFSNFQNFFSRSSALRQETQISVLYSLLEHVCDVQYIFGSSSYHTGFRSLQRTHKIEAFITLLSAQKYQKENDQMNLAGRL